MVGCSPPTFRTNHLIISKIKNLLPCLMTLFKISLGIDWKNLNNENGTAWHLHLKPSNC